FSRLIVETEITETFEYVRETTDNEPLTGEAYLTNNFRCNTGSFGNANKTKVYEVSSGSSIGFATEDNVQNEAWGPLQVYMSKAPSDVRMYDGSGEWFKVFEMGPTAFTEEGIEWASTGLTNFTFTLTDEIATGQYLVRVEQIDFSDSTASAGDNEYYVNCAQVKVTSSSRSTVSSSSEVSIPGVYKRSTSGLQYVNGTVTSEYTMPGPEVW
ncbi:hypothetical protein ASPZODRAFT_29543, partial [Penicilliopsis zonata CBS 506.65]